ncbi:hypothetical protein [Leifsonia sp. 2MCAF36]|uniref:hypothetical protein n=1 Tax=Leifsonia sp. 2MCAF36 TaxID=3232988 RepID=UPI003F9D2DCB
MSVDALAERWTRMWNRELPADQVVTPSCPTYFGRTPRTARPATAVGPEELQRTVDEIGSSIEGIRYGHVSAPLVTEGSNEHAGSFTLLWEVQAPGFGTRSGIDILRYEGDLMTEVWSITGDLEFPPFSD